MKPMQCSQYRTGTYTNIETSIFCTGLIIDRTGPVLAIPANFEQYQPITGVPIGTEKKLYFFIYFLFL